MPVTQHRYAAPGWGTGEVWVQGGVLVLHELAGSLGDATLESHVAGSRTARPRHATAGVPGPLSPKGGASTPTGTLSADASRVANGIVPDLCRRFAGHLGGRRASYDDVDVDESGLTAFQRELLHALRAVPWGEVVSYGELAALAGRPGAARAAGTFCAENQWSLVVPCHRVVASDGIGGYGASGVAVKRRLLALEGLDL